MLQKRVSNVLTKLRSHKAYITKWFSVGTTTKFPIQFECKLENDFRNYLRLSWSAIA